MISVGIDVSKEKSTVCILKPYGEVVNRPFEVCHVEKQLSELTSMLLRECCITGYGFMDNSVHSTWKS